MDLKTALAVLVAIGLSALFIFAPKTQETGSLLPNSNLSGSLTYTSIYGGLHAGIWEEENFNDYLSMRPSLTGTFDGHNLYSQPVPTNIGTIMTRDDAPDVVSAFVKGVFGQYVADGTITDLSDMWRREGWNSAFPESLKRAVSYNGRPYFVPQAIQWNPIFYNRNLFAQHQLDIPTTWEDLLATCETLSAAGVIPFVISASGWDPPVARWFTILNLRLNGHEFHERVLQGEISFTDARIHNVFEHWQALFDHNCFGEDSANSTYFNAIIQLNNGQGAMYNLGEWIFEAIPVAVQPSFDFFAFPTLDPSIEPAEIVHIYGAFIRSDSDNRAAAEDLLRFIGSERSQSLNAIGVNRLVAHRDVNPRYMGQIYHKGLDFISNTPHLVALFELSTRPEFADPAIDLFVEFWADPSDIDGVLEQLEALRQDVWN